MRSLLLLLFFSPLGLIAQKAPLLPFVDNVRVKFEPAGDTTWTVAGFTEFGAKITATDMTSDGRFLAVGDNDGNVSLFDVQARQVLWTRPVIASGAAVAVLKMDATGSQILAAKTPGQNDYSHMYYIAGDGAVTDMGVQEAFSPQCQAVTKMDPSAFLFSPDGTTFFVHYETHARANVSGCEPPAEKYIFMNNLAASAGDVRLIAVEPFGKPEEDEPENIWCTAPPRMAISVDGKTLATSHCNSRVSLWSVAGGKLKHKKTSKNIHFMLRHAGHDIVPGNGYMVFNRRGEIFLGMGAPGQMAKSSIAQLHPKKRLVLLPSGKQLQYIAESKGLTLRLTSAWQKTCRYVKIGDSIYVAGKGTYNYGYGEWLREDRKYANSWLSEFKGDPAGDRGELVELSFRSNEGAEIVLFGGRTRGSAGGEGQKELRNW